LSVNDLIVSTTDLFVAGFLQTTAVKEMPLRHKPFYKH